jgi:hypothetical protein
VNDMGRAGGNFVGSCMPLMGLIRNAAFSSKRASFPTRGLPESSNGTSTECAANFQVASSQDFAAIDFYG